MTAGSHTAARAAPPISLALRAFLISAVVAGCAALAACAVEGVGYGGPAVGVGYVGDFYEPYGYAYGDWAPGYRVGPPRNHDHDHESHGRAPPARAPPSIPTRPRSGGERRPR
ncbi:MAG TPA: hypothetical protein VIX87_02380 [Steroidobacteraceae bacterium]